MNVEFWIDNLREELASRPLKYVELKVYIREVQRNPPVCMLRVVAEPKGFLKMIFGEKTLLDETVRKVGEDKYAIDLNSLRNLFDSQLNDVKALDKACEGLIEKLTELAEKECMERMSIYKKSKGEVTK